jgi:hypothetical protein
MVSASCATVGFWTCSLGARPGAKLEASGPVGAAEFGAEGLQQTDRGLDGR